MEPSTDQWLQWQSGVVEAVRREFRELFQAVHHNDFDWEAWRTLYDEGFLPENAVRQALSLPL